MVTCPPAMCVPSPTATLHSQRKILGYTHFNPNNGHLSTGHVCSQPYCNPALSVENTWHNTPNPNNGHLPTGHVS